MAKTRSAFLSTSFGLDKAFRASEREVERGERALFLWHFSYCTRGRLIYGLPNMSYDLFEVGFGGMCPTSLGILYDQED
jgi:hypothetical protein